MKAIFYPMIILCLPFLNCLVQQRSDYRISIRLISAVDPSGFRIKADVINAGRDTATIATDQWYDYKWGSIRSIAHFIVHIDKKENGEYKLFPPSADIDRQMWGNRTTRLLPHTTYSDTLDVAGSDFPGDGIRKHGFPPGAYRVRVYFNADPWGHSFDIFSDWIEFEIS